MSNQLIKFNNGGGVIQSDSQATAGAVVERDNNGDTYAKGVNASTYLKTGASLFAHGIALTTTATLDTTATVILANAAGGAFTITLPPATTSTDQIYWIFKTDSSGNVPTIKGNGSENINGANTYTGLSSQYSSAILFCDGTQWLRK